MSSGVKKVFVVLSVITVIYLVAVYFMMVAEIDASATAVMLTLFVPACIGFSLGGMWLKYDLNRGKSMSVKPYQVGIPGCIGMAIGIFMINFIWDIL